MLSHDALGVVGQRFGLRQKLESLDHFRIRFRPDFEPFILTESIHEDFGFDIGFDPVVVIDQIRLRVRDIRFVE